MLEFAEPRGPGLRAFLKVGGISLARQQVALAQALDCKRIICLTHGMSDPLLALQHEVEAHGQLFHTIDSMRGLVGLVSSGDELLVIADGLLIDGQQALNLIGAEQGVLVQPIDVGLAAGFERIDLNWATAGLLRIPGRLIDQLMDMPVDIDVVSALTRIALQAGVPQRALPAATLGTAVCSLVRSDAEAHAAEAAWFERHQADFQRWAPASWIGRFAARRIGPTMLDSKFGTAGLMAGGVALLLLALSASWFGYTSLGLGLCAVSWIAWQTRRMVASVEQEMLGLGQRGRWIRELFEAAIDSVIVFVAGWGNAAEFRDSALSPYFAPAMVMILARLLNREFGSDWGRAFGDRMILAGVMMVAGLSGHGQFALQGLAFVLGLVGIVSAERAFRLTRP